MSKEQVSDLLKFLKPFSNEKQKLVLWLRDLVWDLYPEANELIYDNYNALAFGWSVSDKLGHTFCSIAVGRSSSNIHFGFYWGSEVSDPEKLLLGKGNQYRYIIVEDKNTFPEKYIIQLLSDAYTISLKKVKDPNQIKEGLTIVKSISDSKRAKKK